MRRDQGRGRRKTAAPGTGGMAPMTIFEWGYLFGAPFLLPLHRTVRKLLREVTAQYPYRPEVLDVGGRQSPYTIGIPADITITDLARYSALQHRLRLGLTPELINRIRRRRSNVRRIFFDDMTCSSIPDRVYDGVVAVEVLEHVGDGEAFVNEVCRVLKPGGMFLMTTPNAEYLTRTGGKAGMNPDDKRVYTRMELRMLLSPGFEKIRIVPVINKKSRWHSWGLRSWSLRHPAVTLMSALGNFLNFIGSSSTRHCIRVEDAGHLAVIAKKRIEKECDLR
ncbi:MAG: methyltransferase domain-containing protein [Candidatus Omnitrophica bacterium]|nr:methyltransferase domain-containing protein [Candidatus Omnitrophota bacterium]